MKAWDGKHHHVGADLCMFRYHGEVSAALVLGGVDLTGLNMANLDSISLKYGYSDGPFPSLQKTFV